MSTGLVIGRFMPFHAGHAALIHTALQLVDQLTVLVCTDPRDDPTGMARANWVREAFPAVRVLALEAATQDFSATLPPDRIKQACTAPVDMLFSSDSRQDVIAQAIGAQLMLIDPRHEAVPARSAEIRADPFGHWRHIPPAVRPHYARTVCLHGPESTGKSTLATALARHFGTLFVPEYGRTYSEQFGTALDMADLVTIGRTHAALTQALLRQCNRLLVLDTDPLMTAVWADMMIGARDPWFDSFDAVADLYLLLDIDMPFVEDGLRVYGDADARRRFFDLSRAELDRRGVRYHIVSGPAEARFDQALGVISTALGL